MKTVITLKADKEVKESAQKVAAELGLTLSAVVNASLKQFVREKSLNVSVASRMTPRLEKIAAQARKDYKAGKNISPILNSPKEIVEFLRSQR